MVVIATTLVAIVGAFIAHDTLTDRRIADMVKSGTPSAEAMCAMRPSYSGCTTRILGENKK